MFKSTAHRFRRFGVLCFVYSEPETRRPKLGTRFTRGVFLGYSEINAAYLVGVWRRLNGQFKFVAVETESVKFTDFLVRDADELEPGYNQVSVTVEQMERWQDILEPSHVEIDQELVPSRKDSLGSSKMHVQINKAGLDRIFHVLEWATVEGSRHTAQSEFGAIPPSGTKEPPTTGGVHQIRLSV